MTASFAFIDGFVFIYALSFLLMCLVILYAVLSEDWRKRKGANKRPSRSISVSVPLPLMKVIAGQLGVRLPSEDPAAIVKTLSSWAADK